MKNSISFVLCLICIPMLLSGCLDAERISLSVDIAGKTVDEVYGNIGSGSDKIGEIENDFRDLIRDAYGDGSEKKGARIISRELHQNGEQLDGSIRYSFESVEGMLDEYQIVGDEKGDYYMDTDIDMSKKNNVVYEGNGKLIESNGKWLMKWAKDTGTLKFVIRGDCKDCKHTSLLSKWLAWKKTQEKTPKR